MKEQHGHGHHAHSGHFHDGHGHAPASFRKAFAIGIALNVGFVVVEAVYGVLGNSTALLAGCCYGIGRRQPPWLGRCVLRAGMMPRTLREEQDAVHDAAQSLPLVLAAFQRCLEGCDLAVSARSITRNDPNPFAFRLTSECCSIFCNDIEECIHGLPEGSG